MFRVSCLTLEFERYGMKIEESEKAGSHQITRRPHTLTILYMYCTGGTECLNIVPPVQYIIIGVRVGGRLAVVTQW